MADDTRLPPPPQTPEDLSRAALTVSPENKPFTGTQWQNGKAVGPYVAPESANMLAGGTEHTAGGKAPEVTLANAVKDLGWKDFTELPKRPCVRDALLTGIGSGFAFGGVKTIFGVGMYQYCLYRRQAEKDGMMRVIDVMNKKDIERKAREQRKEKVREERRRGKDEELDTRIAAMGGKSEGAAVGGAVREGGGVSGDGGGGGRPWWKVW
ncbi:hypothetical protein LTR10_003268 [Elasticomyces elasticus]|nr:hypothetical protein LTR10_003268 [Elasticomyces elasticus]KAK4969539.1 hypothetical protein LTR42_008810 [Elasticomyces elasticus]